jgi:hypothetical protein
MRKQRPLGRGELPIDPLRQISDLGGDVRPVLKRSDRKIAQAGQRGSLGRRSALCGSAALDAAGRRAAARAAAARPGRPDAVTGRTTT